MRDKGKLIVTVKYRLINVERMMELEDHHW